MTSYQTPIVPDVEEFRRAVAALRTSLDQQVRVEERAWNATVELRTGKRVRTYYMHPSEKALDFCIRICRSEPSCDPHVLNTVSTEALVEAFAMG
jgi:hypothetical protein